MMLEHETEWNSQDQRSCHSHGEQEKWVGRQKGLTYF